MTRPKQDAEEEEQQMRVASLVIFAAAFASACGSVAASATGDSSYDRIEELRALRAVDADRRYDRIEELRDSRQAQSLSPAADDSYDRVEATTIRRHATGSRPSLGAILGAAHRCRGTGYRR